MCSQTIVLPVNPSQSVYSRLTGSHNSFEMEKRVETAASTLKSFLFLPLVRLTLGIREFLQAQIF